MAISALGWPDPYIPQNDITHSPPTPLWSKQDVLAAGIVLAKGFVEDRTFAQAYLDVVQLFNPLDPADLTPRYKSVLFHKLQKLDSVPFNANDFANLHRATWLYLLEGFACLVNKNPHGDFGDPPATADPPTSRGDEMVAAAQAGVPQDATRCFHHVPNGTGYYAVTTLDIPPPVLTS
jgi:hypothetical protein